MGVSWAVFVPPGARTGPSRSPGPRASWAPGRPPKPKGAPPASVHPCMPCSVSPPSRHRSAGVFALGRRFKETSPVINNAYRPRSWVRLYAVRLEPFPPACTPAGPSCRAAAPNVAAQALRLLVPRTAAPDERLRPVDPSGGLSPHQAIPRKERCTPRWGQPKTLGGREDPRAGPGQNSFAVSR